MLLEKEVIVKEMDKNLMEEFESNLEVLEEIDTCDSPWYLVVGGKAILIVIKAS